MPNCRTDNDEGDRDGEGLTDDGGLGGSAEGEEETQVVGRGG